MKKAKKLIRPSLRISLRYSALAIFIILIFSLLLPKILNYGPESINTPFDIQMSGIAYWLQYSLITLLLIIILFTSFHFIFKEIDKFYLSTDKNKFDNIELIKKVRKKCYLLSTFIPIIEVAIPSFATSLVLILTGSHQPIMVFKILVLVFSATLILALSSYIFSKNIYKEILSKTYKDNIDDGLKNTRLNAKFLLQILPIIAFCMVVLTFISYCSAIREKENIYFNLYNDLLDENFSKDITYTESDLYYKFNSLKLYSNSHTKFIIKPDKSVITLNGKEPSYFVIEYTTQIAQKYDGKIYDSYGTDTQGKTIKLQTNSGTYYIGILYDITAPNSLKTMGIIALFLFTIAGLMVYNFSKSISKDISEISDNFERLCSNEFGRTLPITSNDEIGNLINSFNLVQKNSQKQVNLIQNNQDILMERERLASLGQMVGGIAHNLKTPIMSISGAVEGLKDLITEYDKSIEDPEVTKADHHEIANDMRNWISKIDEHTEYMSDIITTVKGQTVTLANDTVVTFTINELLKRVNILMKHELKNSLMNLNVNQKVDSELTITGDINSLVQVLNNLISNAIQASDATINNNIDLNLTKESNNLIISVVDYGKGIPENIKEKLFKEMITTKGKNGTGLGLYMSYSNIKAHFHGTINFESEFGKGTIFNIILPL